MGSSRASKMAMMPKFHKVMREFSKGSLHSGKGGRVVKNRKQAIAIAFSEARMARRAKRK